MAVAAPADTALTECSALELARAIREGEASAREVVEAHIQVHRSAGLNAIVADRFDEALAEADEADRRVAAGEPDLPPLLGVPVTIKESFQVRGMPNSAGLVSRHDRRAETTAPTAQRLIDAGAIVLGVTNVSELTLWIESDNRVYGRTLNAYDPKRIAGGSSGGEGAAVGCGGSPVGLASDIAGSIRIPAFFNGVFGHKSSPHAVPLTGMFPSTDGEAARLLTIGPIARRAEDLMPVMRTLAGPDGVDSRTEEIDFGDPRDVDLDGLDVVVTEHASYVPIRRELRDAREQAAGALAAAGATVRRESLKSLRRALEIYLEVLRVEAGTKTSELLQAEGVAPPNLRSALRRGGPHTLPTLILLAVEKVSDRIPEGRTRRAISAARALSREVEGVLGEGVLLHPPHPRLAPRHNTTIGQSWLLTPTAVFNLLGLPATQVPLGLSRKGLPLGVQVAAPRNRDDLAIAVALELERAFGGWVPPWRG